MKEYKYKINGNDYTVAVGDIENNIAHIEVNGKAFDVELPEQPKAAPVVKRVAVADAPVAAKHQGILRQGRPAGQSQRRGVHP